MALKLFILGRPGSGKSYAARYVVKHITKHFSMRDDYFIRINDYDFLSRKFQEDKEHKCFKPIKYKGNEGFDVTDFTVLDEALIHLRDEAKKHHKSGLHELIIVEFARADYSIALSKFESEFLQDAYFLFIETDITRCIERVNKRIVHKNKTPDDTYISEGIIKDYYYQNNIFYMIDLAKEYKLQHKQVRIIFNVRSVRHFQKMLDEFIEFLIDEQIGKLRETDPVHITIVRPNSEIAK